MSDNNWTPEQLQAEQLRVRAEGRCGSLQTFDGRPCRRRPKAGYPVCPNHGQRAPQTIAKAERLLAVARMPAIQVLLDELDQYQEETCETCGYPHHTLKARKHISVIAFKLLDRTGFGPRSTIDLTARKLEDAPRDVAQLTEEEFQELSGMLAEEDRFWARVQARGAADAARKVLAPAPETVLPSAVGED